MKMRCYSVFDLKVGAFAAPFFMRSNAEAIRAFSDTVNDSSTSLNRHPEDYCLYCIADWDDASGELSALEPSEMLGKAIEYLERGAPVEDLFSREAK